MPGPTEPPSRSSPDPGRAPDQAPYEVLSELGRGSWGAVFRARLRQTGMECALKLMRFKRHADPEVADIQRRRFAREGRALARLAPHPNVVGVLGSGHSPDGEAYLLLELVEGHSLREVLDEKGKLKPKRALKLVAAIGRGLEHIHMAGILHRDLKPENVLIDRDGTPRLTDFGYAQLADEGRTLTHTDEAVGTPLYMSPEMASFQPDEAGPESDVFGLGVMLYEMLAGAVPFDGETPIDVLESIRTTEPKPLREVDPDIPPPVEAVCMRAIAKDRALRYADARSLVADIERVLAGEAPIAATREASRAMRRVRATRRVRRVLPTAVLAAVVGAVGTVAVVLVVRRGDLPGPGAATLEPGEAPPVAPAAAVAEGDYTLLLDAPERAAALASGPLLEVAAALADGAADPDLPALAARLGEVRDHRARRAAIALRAELLGLLGDEDGWRRLLGEAEVEASPVLRAQRARLLADAGAPSEQEVARVRAAARPLGLGPAVERVLAGAPRSLEWALRQADRCAVLTGRLETPPAFVNAERLVRLAHARGAGETATLLARARIAFERRDDAAVLALTERALEDRALAPVAIALARRLRARVHLDAGDAPAAVTEARRARELEPSDVAGAILEVEALLAAGDPLALRASSELLALTDEAMPSERPRTRAQALFRARILRARALYAEGQLADARNEAETLAKTVEKTVDRWGGSMMLLAIGDLDRLIDQDPESATALFVRALKNLQAEPGSAVWRAGIDDVVRAASRGLPQGVMFCKDARELMDQMPFEAVMMPGAAPPAGGPPMDAADRSLARGLAALASEGGASRLPGAIAAVDHALMLRPTWAAAWIARGQCLYEARQPEKARRSLEAARRLVPEVADIWAFQLKYANKSDPRRQALERLVLHGVNTTYLGIITRRGGGEDLLDPATRARAEELKAALRAVQSRESFLDGDADNRPDEFQEDLAGGDGGDDPVVWHLIGAARMSVARFRERQDEGDDDAGWARAAEAFEMALACATERTAPLHRAAAVRARMFAHLRDARTRELLAACMEHVERTHPRGHVSQGYAGFGPLYVERLSELDGFSNDLAAQRTHLAQLLLAAGDLDGARREVERAAMLNPLHATSLARVYRAAVEQRKRDGR